MRGARLCVARAGFDCCAPRNPAEAGPAELSPKSTGPGLPPKRSLYAERALRCTPASIWAPSEEGPACLRRGSSEEAPLKRALQCLPPQRLPPKRAASAEAPLAEGS